MGGLGTKEVTSDLSNQSQMVQQYQNGVIDLICKNPSKGADGSPAESEGSGDDGGLFPNTSIQLQHVGGEK